MTLQNKSDIDSYKFYNDYTGNFTYTVTNNFPNIDTNKNNTVNNAQLELNGVDRTSNYDGSYYNYVTSYDTNINTPADGINFYSFALNPNDIQPSGTCNFSRLNRKTIKLSLTDEFLNRISSSDYILINFLSVNYNILKFNKGLCNLVFCLLIIFNKYIIYFIFIRITIATIGFTITIIFFIIRCIRFII